MQDLISRQDAIDAIKILLEQSEDDEHDKIWNNAIRGAIKSIKHHVPSAQPDLSEYSDKLWKRAYERGKAEAQPEIIHCRECKHWRQQTNYQGNLLSFGFCESDDMWRSLYGETPEVDYIYTDDNHYCGYAERRTDDLQ